MDQPVSGGDDRDRRLQALYDEIRRRQPARRVDRLVEFARHFYATAAIADLREWRLDDLYGATVACWQFIQEYRGDDAKVRVFNPQFEEHGWQSSHTIIALLHVDMPFIVDSVRILLNRQNLTIHAIHNAVLVVRRNERFLLEKLLPTDSRVRGLRREILVSLEVDRHTDPAQLAALERELAFLLGEIRIVVEDFKAMQARTGPLIEELKHPPVGIDPADAREAAEFIRWLRSHFTFLGYDEYRLVERDERQVLEPVPGSQLGRLKVCDENSRTDLLQGGNREADAFTLIPDLLSFSKADVRSRIHRPGYPDYISIKRCDVEGRVIGEARFLGLFTSSVYIQSSRHIPVVRRKVDAVMKQSGFVPRGHDWKTLLQILEIYPRDDLFQIGVDELYRTALAILQIHERRRIRLFIHRDAYGHFFSCLVYAPRDVYSTEYRRRVEAVLLEALGCEQAEFNTYFSESVLARTQFILRPARGTVTERYDTEQIEEAVRRASRTWTDDLYDALIEAFGEEAGIQAYNNYGSGFPASYRADFMARNAVADIRHLMSVGTDRPLALSFYRALEREEEAVNFKLYHLHHSVPLSDVLPVLENLGLRVIDEHPYQVLRQDEHLWIHDFNLRFVGQAEISIPELKDAFQEAFLDVWYGRAVNDDFNRLVLAARLRSREVSMLRAYAAYLKQLNFNISAEAISATLYHQVDLCRQLIDLIHARFDPRRRDPERAQGLEQSAQDGLEQVPSLTEDRVIRQYLTLIRATKRINYYQAGPDGASKPYLAFKLAPREIPAAPRPRPLYEIFVFSPRVEGVHLRAGKVARGGLRWSDRLEDYRTEVLGLVKAQQVKNAVIVPVGAKGGFVAKRLDPAMSREQWLDEGIACYRMLIGGLLDLTDNLVDGAVVAPPGVERLDEDDTYLVVAADKGTASFSDIANDVAAGYGFWLGDAFASGGSQGYDHKKMGITARGAWISVERHFRELGLNTADETFRVLGIGDMSGDVFGNGMLMSGKILLVAAFNHQHIFVDPMPDPETGLRERARLFALPRSSWRDYDPAMMSEGGGVFDRSAKSVRLSPQIQALIGIEQERMTPAELISALLRMPVDLLWNGGIGTYVKASGERHAEVGDKANDAVRIDASELRCKVVGEGGNLGLTQRARIEYALRGGRLNSDFIDNAGGVDCSDHEVNIKILLNELVTAGDLTTKQRNRLLHDMTGQVAERVLMNNYRQVQSISLMEIRSAESMAEYRRFITHLESAHRLDRSLEFLPDDETLAERHVQGQGLTRPELSVLVSYSKAELKEMLLASTVPDDPYLQPVLETAFPPLLIRRFGEALHARHRLRREIIATQLANHIVNYMGVNFVERLQASTGADIESIARAYALVRELFDLEALWQQIEALDHQVSVDTQVAMMHDLQHLIRRASRWFVRNRRGTLDCAREARMFGDKVMHTAAKLGELMVGRPFEVWQAAHQRYTEAGVPDKLARTVAATRSLYSILGMTEVAAERGIGMDQVVRAYFELGQTLELHWFAEQLNGLVVENYWQALAREAFRDDLDWQHRALVSTLLRHYRRGVAIETLIADWLAQNRSLVERWRFLLAELKAAEKTEYSMYTVAVRELFDLAKNSGLLRGERGANRH